MSAEPQGDLAGLARPVALAATLEPLSRLVAFSRAIASEQVEQRMLRVASRELTLMLNGEACLVSQLEDGLLREVADYSSSDRQVARGLSYYLADYPSTAALPRDACLALERARGEGRRYEPAHRGGRPARRRGRRGARSRPRRRAQRRAWSRPPRHRQGSRSGVDPQQARPAHRRGVDGHEDPPRGRRAHPQADPVSERDPADRAAPPRALDRKSTRLNSSHGYISYAVF